MKSILFINQYYWPDLAATGQLLQELCEDLAGAGYKVSVICARTSYVKRNRLPRLDIHQGVRIIRTGLAGRQSVSAIRRIGSYAAFYIAACFRLGQIDKPDILVVESSPPLILVGVAVIAWLRSIPLIHIAQDVYPEVAESVGTIRPRGLLAKVLHLCNRWALGRCREVVVLGRDMFRFLSTNYGLLPQEIHIVPNWADYRSLQHSLQEVLSLKTSWGISDKKIIMYSGNLGRVHIFRDLVEIARRWKERKDIIFLFVGGGKWWESLRRDIDGHGLENILLKPYQDRAELGISLALADIHVVTQRVSTTGLVVPSKLYGALAVGRPVVFLGDSECEVGLTLRETGAGVVVRPGDLVGLENALDSFLNDRDRSRRAGKAGLAYMQQRGDRKYRTEEYAEIIGEALKCVR